MPVFYGCASAGNNNLQFSDFIVGFCFLVVGATAVE
jgi:hypothetical protein